MTWFAPTRHVARKVHRCDGCRRTIQPGERYKRGAGKEWGEAPHSWKECAHCEVLIRDYSDEFDDAGIWCDEYIDDWEPRTIRGLRFKVMRDRAWARRDGTLYPVPRA